MMPGDQRAVCDVWGLDFRDHSGKVSLAKKEVGYSFFQSEENVAQKSEQECLSKNVLHKNSSGKLAEGTFLYIYICGICVENTASNLRNLRAGSSGNCI